MCDSQNQQLTSLVAQINLTCCADRSNWCSIKVSNRCAIGLNTLLGVGANMGNYHTLMVMDSLVYKQTNKGTINTLMW
jgi:hypothetical protein